MKKILLINCFFGEFPWYFDLFLKSCYYNSTINFIIFSDNITKINLPKNVKIIPLTLAEFNILASEKLGIEVDIKKAYKLCDFKPAYGVIFSKYIENYEFWGITDIDIVFGRIREFMTDDLLNKYQVISVRNDYPTGSFMLFKNINYVNNLFKKSKDYKKVFTSNIHYCFDECNFKHNYLQNGGDIFEIDCEIESMHHVIKNEEKRNLRPHFDFLVIEGLPGQLKWERGFLSFKNQFEVLLYHLILYKGNRYTRKKKLKTVPDKFYIDKYLIRVNELNSLCGTFLYAIYNKIIPYLKKALFAFDFFLSKRLNLKITELETINLISNRLRIIAFKESKNLHFFKSIFFKNSFFIAFFSNVRYLLKEDNQIIRIKLNGDVSEVL